MIEIFHDTTVIILELLSQLQNQGMTLLIMIAPMLMLVELPYYLVVLIGVTIHSYRNAYGIEMDPLSLPKVSCIVTCYSEGESVTGTLLTLCEQLYRGPIEILVMIDGAIQNQATYQAAKRFVEQHSNDYPNRRLMVIPKWQRGGRVSSLNTGLTLSTGEIVMALDGDTSFENEMVQMAIRHFADPRVSAVSGALLVRNADESLVTRMQDLEYRLSLILAKIGLSEFNIINNVSGAFGIFRRTVLLAAGGWNTGTAEDLDLTLRLKHYTKRNHQRIAFEPQAIGFTDVPNTWLQFFKQRLRWDGDLIFLYLRKHWQTFRPRLIGWRNYIILIWGGLLFQLISPFVIAGYLAWLAFSYPLPQFLAIFFFIFFFYLVITSINLLFYLIVGSRQPLKDIRFFIYIPVFTLFVCALRLWNVVTTLNEMFRMAHQESAMAPWWVLKRPGKY